MNRNITVVGRFLLSALFIFSAISKYISLPFFDGMVAEFLIGEDYFEHPKAMLWTQWLTRLLITAELVLGLALLQNKGFKKVVMPATVLTLVLFTIHLVIEGFSKPNGFIEGNCGCFGDVLPMNHLESIVKNLVALAISAWVWIKHRNERIAAWTLPLMAGVISLFTLSFGIKDYTPSPLSHTTPQVIDTLLADTPNVSSTETLPIEEITETVAIPQDNPPAEQVETAQQTRPQKPGTKALLLQYVPPLAQFDLNKGTKMVCLFSMTCSHCQEVYRDLCSVNDHPNLPPVYLVNFGSNYEQNYFFSQAGNCKHSHHLMEDYTVFKRLLEGRTYPRILVFEEGKLIKEWDVDSYTKQGFTDYFDIVKEEKEEEGLILKDDVFGW